MGKATAGVGEIYKRPRSVAEMADMYLPARNPENDALLVSLGRAVMGWNTAEGCLRVLLDVLADEDGGAGRATILALSAETTVAGIESAVEALAKVVLDKERADDVKFVVDYLSLVRAYRNYYVHGLNHISTHQGHVAAPVLTWSAKRGIKHNVDQVTAADLDKLATWSALGAAYIMALIGWWYPVSLPGDETIRPVRPEKPPELKKTTNDLTYYVSAPARGAKRKRPA